MTSPLRAFIVAMSIGFCLAPAVFAQTETATVSGRVTDVTGAIVPKAEVRLVSVERGVTREATTNDAGIYTFPGCQPGQYHMTVRKDGFRQIEFVGLILNVQDHIENNFRLQVGSVSESVTVSGGAPLVNTEDATVSTVVDRKFVGNMPLNGRSFQDLILLTPGVVTSSPQSGNSFAGQQGEFSVNGQRTESNYYTVDGVSANVGANSGVLFDATSAGVSGSLPGPTALGTTQTLVSVDALEEFRVQSSTYSAEYGHNPGGQFSFTTRSGTNEWHGTGFDYVRNGTLDANDWFNDYLSQKQAALRQNDFGGTLGGPIRIPSVYNGKDRTFFFFSYEGLRLVQPQSAVPNFVPDNSLRQSAPSALQSVLNGFPIANGPDIGNGLAEFLSTWSNPSRIDALSLRLDHNVNAKLRLFYRFSYTPSTANMRGTGISSPGNNLVSDYDARTNTLGVTGFVSDHINNDFRLNYSSNESKLTQLIDGFGGGKPVDLIRLQGLNSPTANVDVSLFFPGHSAGLSQTQESGLQRHWNFVDTLAISVGQHQFKFGVDYRRLTATADPFNPAVGYFYVSEASLQANAADFAFGTSEAAAYPIYKNFSAFATDEWKVAPRLNLSIGLRWEVNPAPGVTRGSKPYTVAGNNLGSFALAPQGTPLWNTTWFNLAPRFGAAYILVDRQQWETVVRGGGGVFFDTGQQAGSAGFQGPGFSAQFTAPPGAAFPLPFAEITPPIANPPVPPYQTTVVAFPAHLQLPYTLQWNASIEQALGASQALTVSYVGSHAGRLTGQYLIQGGALSSNFPGGLTFYQTGLTADYNAFQAQFQRRMIKGLQALGSYTWSHSIDYGSANILLFGTRGNSDFDVRQNLSGALSYELPNAFQSSFGRALLHNWAIDDRLTVRSGFPVSLNGSQFVDPATGKAFNSGLNLLPGLPIYIYGSQCAAVYANGLSCPGGRAINPSAFSIPAAGLGNAPRNFVRGFGAWQTDVAIRREFPIYERLRLQFRAEAFNILNHPNFGAINSNYCVPGPTSGCTFGQVTATLAQSLGILSPIYQRGGARSLQFALKLMF
jgi:hypothetical protein